MAFAQVVDLQGPFQKLHIKRPFLGEKSVAFFITVNDGKSSNSSKCSFLIAEVPFRSTNVLHINTHPLLQWTSNP